MHTAQPSLSQQIKDLEDYIGSTLLERNKRRVSLTKAGEVFLQQARIILDNAEKAKKNGTQSSTRTNCAYHWICPISRS
nr:LysR family transcriptional regulator [Photorhabdus temperata]